MASVTIHQSGLNRLTTCEKQWAYDHLDGIEDQGSEAMWKGSVFHLCCQSYREHGDPEAAVKFMVDTFIPAGEVVSDKKQQALEDGVWLFHRYVQHYGDERPKWTKQLFEQQFRLRLPGRHIWVQGTIDELAWDLDGKLWVVERKTMADWSRLDYLVNDPQVTIYYWAARELGWEPHGILYDAARNYRWAAKNEHKYPPEVSFERRWLDRNDAHLDEMTNEVVEGAQRMLELRKGRRPLRSIGQHCSWCPFKQPCLDELAFPGSDSRPIIIEDDEEVVFE